MSKTVDFFTREEKEFADHIFNLTNAMVEDFGPGLTLLSLAKVFDDRSKLLKGHNKQICDDLSRHLLNLAEYSDTIGQENQSS